MLVISRPVARKLEAKHAVKPAEVAQCFENRCGRLLTDTREEHRTDPPTLWFIAETDHGRLLKVIFIQQRGAQVIKSAYPPNEREIAIYERKAK